MPTCVSGCVPPKAMATNRRPFTYTSSQSLENHMINRIWVLQQGFPALALLMARVSALCGSSHPVHGRIIGSILRLYLLNLKCILPLALSGYDDPSPDIAKCHLVFERLSARGPIRITCFHQEVKENGHWVSAVRSACFCSCFFQNKTGT